MTKTLNKGEDNSVNLVFGTLTDGKRSYGRDDNGNRITISEKTYVNGHEAVDLGLSVKWATEDYTGNPVGVPPVERALLMQSDLSDAAKSWGDTWSVPTQAQYQELLDNCTITKDTVEVPVYMGGSIVDYTSSIGYRFTSKINGNSIRLYYGGTGNFVRTGVNGASVEFRVTGKGTEGYYWSSTFAGMETSNSRGDKAAKYYLLEFGEYRPDGSGSSYSFERKPFLTTEFDSYYRVRFVCP